MDLERMNRLIEAKKYQEKAIKALFPENMQGHIDVIQNELSSMIKEAVFQVLQSEEGMEKDSKVKKVIIS